MMMSSSILRRLLSHNINGPRKFGTTTAAVNRELLKPPSPWLMLPPSFLGGSGDMTYNFYSPIKDKVVSFNNRGGKQEADLMRDDDTVLTGSSHGWLALYNTRTRGQFLSNPLSGRRINLPPYAGKPFRDDGEEEGWRRWPAKVILSSSPDDEDCRALMILGTSERAAFCRPGRSSEWSPLGRWYDETFNGLRFYNDFVYSAAQKKFLGIVLSAGMFVFREELEGWDITDPVHARTVLLDGSGKPSGPWLFFRVSLVSGEQPDQLFLVRRNFTERETVDARVYRIVEGELELCSSLDDLVMFVGINHSFAVKASEYPGLKPNCIYFSDGRSLIYDKQYMGVFDYQNKTFSPVYYPFLDHPSQTPRLQAHPWFTPTLD